MIPAPAPVHLPTFADVRRLTRLLALAQLRGDRAAELILSGRLDAATRPNR